MAGLLVSLVVGNLILVYQAQFKTRDLRFRAAVRLDPISDLEVQNACFYFHALQPLALLAMRRVSLSHLGTWQFLAIHASFASMFFLAKDEIH